MINEKGEKMICDYCKKGLKPYRKSNDWDSRHLHKKCWNILQMHDYCIKIQEECKKKNN